MRRTLAANPTADFLLYPECSFSNYTNGRYSVGDIPEDDVQLREVAALAVQYHTYIVCGTAMEPTASGSGCVPARLSFCFDACLGVLGGVVILLVRSFEMSLKLCHGTCAFGCIAWIVNRAMFPVCTARALSCLRIEEGTWRVSTVSATQSERRR